MTAKKASANGSPELVPPPADQHLLDRIDKLEERVAKLTTAVAGLLAAQITPTLQQKLQEQVLEQLG